MLEIGAGRGGAGGEPVSVETSSLVTSVKVSPAQALEHVAMYVYIVVT